MWIMGSHGATGVSQNAGILVVLVITAIKCGMKFLIHSQTEWISNFIPHFIMLIITHTLHWPASHYRGFHPDNKACLSFKSLPHLEIGHLQMTPSSARYSNKLLWLDGEIRHQQDSSSSSGRQCDMLKNYMTHCVSEIYPIRYDRAVISMDLLPDKQNYRLRMRRECRERFQRKQLVRDPGMQHSTCVTHVPWCMSESLTCGGGENAPALPAHAQPALLCIW